MSTMSLQDVDDADVSRTQRALVQELELYPEAVQALSWLETDDLSAAWAVTALEQARDRYRNRLDDVDPRPDLVADDAVRERVAAYGLVVVEQRIRRELMDVGLLQSRMTEPRGLVRAEAGDATQTELVTREPERRLNTGEEREVLAAALSSSAVREQLVRSLDPADFHDPDVSRAWEAVEEMHRQGRYVDAVTVDDYIHRQPTQAFTTQVSEPLLDLVTVGESLKAGRNVLDEILPPRQAEAAVRVATEGLTPTQLVEQTRQRLAEENGQVRRMQEEMASSQSIPVASDDGPAIRDEEHVRRETGRESRSLT
ncbi:MAG: DnaB-like helicase N-terminal domain-containing protein [Janthinobacterium lividum]